METIKGLGPIKYIWIISALLIVIAAAFVWSPLVALVLTVALGAVGWLIIINTQEHESPQPRPMPMTPSNSIPDTNLEFPEPMRTVPVPRYETTQGLLEPTPLPELAPQRLITQPTPEMPQQAASEPVPPAQSPQAPEPAQAPVVVDLYSQTYNLVEWALSEPMLRTDNEWARAQGAHIVQMADQMEDQAQDPNLKALVMALRIWAENLERGLDATRARALLRLLSARP